MKKYAQIATLTLLVSIILQLAQTLFFNDRVLDNPSPTFELVFTFTNFVIIMGMFVSLATLLAIGGVLLKRSLQNRQFTSKNPLRKH